MAGWAALLLVGLALVVLKPWAGLARGEATDAPGRGSYGVAGSGAGSRPAVVPSATPRPAVLAADPGSAGPEIAAFCLDPNIWLITSVQKDGAARIHMWTALEPTAAATGPADPTIPGVSIAATGILELGWCAPISGPERPTAGARVDVWHVGSTGAERLVPPLIRPRRASRFGAMYDPPSIGAGPAAVDEAWPPGRVVFRYMSGTQVRWFAVDLGPRVPDP